jgi:hypothetical protein
MLLRTTDATPMGGSSSTGVGGSGNQGMGGGTLSMSTKTSPFCKLTWGQTWRGNSQEVLSTGNTAYPVGLGMMSIWAGYETDNNLNSAIRSMLVALSPGGDTALQGLTPVLYAYFIPFKAEVKDQLNKNCDVTATTLNICTDGATWIRNNRDYLRNTYSNYAAQIASIWGKTSPLVWLFEPDFNNYIRQSQNEPLSLDELNNVALDLVGTVKAQLPNAIISYYAAASLNDFAEYFGALNLSLVDLVNVTGSAQYDYFFSGNSGVYPASTYRRLHEVTGTASVDVMNQRISDGVVAVQMETGTSTMQERIDTISSQLTPLNCGK